MELYHLIPKRPVRRKYYICQKDFDVSYLLDLEQEKIGDMIIAIDTYFSTIAYNSNDDIRILKEYTSGVKNKQKKGGFSQQRYERNRRIGIQQFQRRIADQLKEWIIESETYKINGIKIIGSGNQKYKFIKELDERLRKKIISVETIGYKANREGLLAVSNHI